MARVVMKVGGRVAGDSVDSVRKRLAAGDEVVVVHGAGPQITAELEARGIPVRFVRGRRYTDAPTLAVVRESLLAVGGALTAALGPNARHLVGDEIGLRAKRVPKLGLVGEPQPCRPPAVVTALAQGLVPVVTPLAVGPLNVNADEAATALAAGIDADRIVFVTDVSGVYLDGAVVPLLDADRATSLLDAEVFEGGIVPKLMAAVGAAKLGVAVEIGETAVVA